MKRKKEREKRGRGKGKRDRDTISSSMTSPKNISMKNYVGSYLHRKRDEHIKTFIEMKREWMNQTEKKKKRATKKMKTCTNSRTKPE